MSRSTVWLFFVVFNTFEKKDPKETLKTPPPGPGSNYLCQAFENHIPAAT